MQDGNYLKVSIKPLADETIMVHGKSVAAKRYQLTAEKIDIQLWYSATGEWLQLESLTEGGYKLSYRLP